MIVAAARTSADSQYPATMPPRFVAPSIRRRAKPDSKSRATEKPVNTPPNVDGLEQHEAVDQVV